MTGIIESHHEQIRNITIYSLLSASISCRTIGLVSDSDPSQTKTPNPPAKIPEQDEHPNVSFLPPSKPRPQTPTSTTESRNRFLSNPKPHRPSLSLPLPLSPNTDEVKFTFQKKAKRTETEPKQKR